MQRIARDYGTPCRVAVWPPAHDASSAMQLVAVGGNNSFNDHSNSNNSNTSDRVVASTVPYGTNSSRDIAIVSFSQASARQWRRGYAERLLESIEQRRREQEQRQPYHEEKEEAQGLRKAFETSPIFICTAHQREDQIETLLLKLIRGVHLTNFQMVGRRMQPALFKD